MNYSNLIRMAFLCGTLLSSKAGVLPNVNFVYKYSLGTGQSPYSFNSVVAADVNGDGKADIISANYLDSSLTVFTNDGTGNFVQASSPQVGTNPISIVAADVNGDGKVDLICANYGDNTLTVLTNDGSGGFVISSSPPVGVNPRALVAADINGDGKVDLICANSSGNTLTVLTNDGSGGFVTSSSPPVGLNPRALVTADINGDGKVDLICADYSDNTLTVLTNDGSGGFVISFSPPVGLNPRALVAADINGDGRVDLIVANYGDNTLTVLTNDGGGGFVVSSTPAVSTTVSILAVDVNGDGRPDLVCANYSGGEGSSLTVLVNDGNGYFELASNFHVEMAPVSIAAADINGDGKPDLIVANLGEYSLLTVLTNATIFPITPPVLGMRLSSHDLVFSWPTNGPVFTLQQCDSCDSTNWMDMTNAITLVEGKNQVILSPMNGNSFFRLKSP